MTDVMFRNMRGALVITAIVVATFLIPISRGLAEGISLARIPHIYEITIDPAAPDHLLLATPKGLYRLTPDIRMLPLLDGSHDITGLVVSDNGKHLLVSGKKNRKPFGILLSGDGGKSWQARTDDKAVLPAYRLLKISGPDGRLLAVGKNLMQSRDAGKIWTNAGAMPTASLGLAASRKSADKLLAATAKGLKSSIDGGKSWQATGVGPSGKPASMVAMNKQDRAWAFVVGAGLYVGQDVFADGKGKWRKLAEAKRFDGALIHLTSHKSRPGHLIAVTQYMKVLQSRDGGLSWAPFAK